MYNFATIKKDCERLSKTLDLTSFRGTSVLVTGANGLIGGFLADLFCFLNDSGYDIKINLTSYSSKDNARRISHIVDREDVNYFSWDCSEPVPTQKLPAQIYYTFFCSGYGQPSKFLKNNIKTALINVIGPESILAYMKEGSGGNFLFLSTSEIYGNPPDEMLPTPEEYGGLYDIESNRAAYKESKKLGEVICKEYNKAPNMSVKSARVALTYGPGALLTDQRVLQEFIFKAHRNGEIRMLDAGASIRNYLYITDSVEILLNIILHGEEMVYNVGGDVEPVSIYELASIIGNIFQVETKKGNNPDKTIDASPRNVGLSMKRYREEFPEYGNNIVNLQTGINNTIDWFNFNKMEKLNEY